jgi:hypothetical protein
LAKNKVGQKIMLGKTRREKIILDKYSIERKENP